MVDVITPQRRANTYGAEADEHVVSIHKMVVHRVLRGICNIGKLLSRFRWTP